MPLKAGKYLIVIFAATALATPSTYSQTTSAKEKEHSQEFIIFKNMWQTELDTYRKAASRCKKEQKMAKLTKAAGPLSFPYGDWYICVKP